MDQALHQFEADHYFSLVMYAFALMGLMVSLVKRKKFPELKYFPIYFLLSLIQSLFDLIEIITGSATWWYFSAAAMNVFIVFEFFLVTNFFFKLKLSNKIAKTIVLFSVIFYGFTVLIWIKNQTICQYPYEIFILESALIIPLTLSYFYILFKRPPIKELRKDFAFWVSTGLLFFFTTTFPLFLITKRLEDELYALLFPITYAAYSILFALIIKAFLCKPEIVK